MDELVGWTSDETEGVGHSSEENTSSSSLVAEEMMGIEKEEASSNDTSQPFPLPPDIFAEVFSHLIIAPSHYHRDLCWQLPIPFSFPKGNYWRLSLLFTNINYILKQHFSHHQDYQLAKIYPSYNNAKYFFAALFSFFFANMNNMSTMALTKMWIVCWLYPSYAKNIDFSSEFQTICTTFYRNSHLISFYKIENSHQYTHFPSRGEIHISVMVLKKKPKFKPSTLF